MVIAVSYHDTVAKLQAFAEFAQGSFDRPEWYSLLERHAATPFVVIAAGDGGKVALPLSRSGSTLTSLTNWFAFSWRPLGSEHSALLAIASDLRGKADRIILAPVPDEDGSTTRLAQAFRGAGWLVFVDQIDVNHVLETAGRTFEQYRAALPGTLRTALGRKAKKVDIVIHTDFDQQTWAIYREIYAQSWKPEEELAVLLEDFARAESDAGHFRLGIARAKGRPVAVQFWTVEAGTAYIHKLAHLDEASSISAGTTLTAAMFEHVIDKDGVMLVDFGTGDDAYKRDWMDHVRPRYRLSCYDWRKPATWSAIAKALARRLARPKARG